MPFPGIGDCKTGKRASRRRRRLAVGEWEGERRSGRYYRLTDENSVLQFLPHSGAGAARNQTNTKVQNANTATQPDTTIVMSSLSACLSHLRICALPWRNLTILRLRSRLLRYNLFMVKPASALDH
jgi:hypothetical protein